MSIPLFHLHDTPLTGRNLVQASAGTGKTFTLAALFVRLLLEAGLTVDRILVVTFTEAATEELRGRIRERIRGAAAALEQGRSADPFLAGLLDRVAAPGAARQVLVDALRCFDEAPIFTIHGFCQRVLQEKAFECGAPFDTELLTDEGPLLHEVVRDFWRREAYPASAGFLRHLAGQGVTPVTLATFLRRKARAPLLRVTPEAAEAPDLDEASCREAFAALAASWPGARAEVAAILTGSPALNRTNYPLRSVPGWLAELDGWVAAGDPLAACCTLPRLASDRIASAVKKGHAPPAHPFFDACADFARRRAELEAHLGAALRALKVRLIDYARRELPRRKAERNVRCFDDLLTEVRRVLEGDGSGALAAALRDRYPAALIDEFQDTDPVQYAIFRTLYPDDASRLFLIGDPKQAIYGFRGADVFAYMDAASRVTRGYTLGVNYRSVPSLVGAVNALFQGAAEPFVFPEIPFQPVAAPPADPSRGLTLGGRPDPSPVEFWFVPRPAGKAITKAEADRTLPGAVASEVVRWLRAGAAGEARIDGRALGPGDVAVLVRTNDQARRVQEALGRAGVPTVVYSSESLFASPEAQEWLRVLAAAAEPAREGKVRAALVTGLLGLDAAELDRLAGDDAAWDRRLRRFAAYRELWMERGFVAMAEALLAEERVRERLLPLPDGERRLTNHLHCVEVLQRASLAGRLGPEGLVKWLGRRIEEGDEGEEHQLRLETDERAVKVVTVHKSKGLEYPITFCPFAWHGSRVEPDEDVVCHAPEDRLQVILDLGSDRRDEHRHLAEREALAENLRLLYVALTRARVRTHVVWGAFRGAETSALAWLLHPPPADGGASGVVDRLAGHAGALADEAMRRDLAALAERSGGTVAVRDLPEATGERFDPPAPAEAPLACRAFPGSIPADEGLLSFSSLVSGREEAADLPDRDEGTGEGNTGAGAPSGGAPTIFDFPRGAQPGSCLHAVFEEVDFAGGRRSWEAVAEAHLERVGLDRSWAGAVADTVGRVLTAPLPEAAPDFHLGRLSRAERIHELEFYLPAGLLTPAALARAFPADGPPPVARLRRALDELAFRPARGFLKGFVDLVFEAGGRFHLLDWKSNHLGHRAADYGPEALQAAMDQHLYVLQYHLYAAALHRHLAARLPGYDYGAHFGQVYYLFVRGVDPAAGADCGVYRARPEESVVRALADLIARGA